MYLVHLVLQPIKRDEVRGLPSEFNQDSLHGEIAPPLCQARQLGGINLRFISLAATRILAIIVQAEPFLTENQHMEC